MKFATIVIVFLALLLGIFCLWKQDKSQSITDSTSIHLIDKTQLETAIAANPSLQLVDIRTSKAAADGIIPSAVNIDFFREDFMTQLSTFDKEAPLYLYCKNGGRSNKAALLLVQSGFKEVYDLEGGYLAWKR